jgi:hypothetical protein
MQTSWVVHRGGLTRALYLPRDNDNLEKFALKHGADVGFMKNRMLNLCHPTADGQAYGFPLDMAAVLA